MLAVRAAAVPGGGRFSRQALCANERVWDVGYVVFAELV